MNDITKSGLLFNAASIPCSFFMKLCAEYDPSEIFRSSSILEALGLSEAQRQRLSGLLVKDGWAEQEQEQLAKLGARFITAKDIDYPAKLWDLSRPPVGLYVRGSANLSLPSVAVVGTRKPSIYGANTASYIARSLAHHRLATISGGARGIDSSAHIGSLTEGGVTIAIFGTSIDKAYPTENRDLFKHIIESHGAVVSEYPLKSAGEAWHFPERNRLIVALSSRVVVVESPEDGGAMITAGIAGKVGRELWAVPGRINEPVCGGSNRLLNEGAKCLYDVSKFVEGIAGRSEQIDLFGDDVPKETGNEAPSMSDDEKVIYSLLQRKGKCLIDELVSESNLELGDVQSALIGLEADGLVVEVSGRYSAEV